MSGSQVSMIRRTRSSGSATAGPWTSMPVSRHPASPRAPEPSHLLQRQSPVTNATCPSSTRDLRWSRPTHPSGWLMHEVNRPPGRGDGRGQPGGVVLGGVAQEAHGVPPKEGSARDPREDLVGEPAQRREVGRRGDQRACLCGFVLQDRRSSVGSDLELATHAMALPPVGASDPARPEGPAPDHAVVAGLLVVLVSP